MPLPYVHDSAGVIDKPEQIRLYHIRSVISALQLELQGIRLKRAIGPIARRILMEYSIVPKRLNRSVLGQLQLLHNQESHKLFGENKGLAGKPWNDETPAYPIRMRLNVAGDLPGARGNDEARMVRLRGAE